MERTMIGAKPGHAVEFHGLKGAAHLNGTKGRLLRFDKKEERWVVQCDDESNGIVKAKAVNLHRVSGTNMHRDPMLMEMLRNQQHAAGPEPSLPPMNTSSTHGNVTSLNEAVLDSYFKRRMGGAVVFYSNEYMMAIEFNGPSGRARSADVEMVWVDNERRSQVVAQQRRCTPKELGRLFLMGEDTEYIEATNGGAFLALLERYQRRCRSNGLIDMKSGLKLYEATIA